MKRVLIGDALDGVGHDMLGRANLGVLDPFRRLQIVIVGPIALADPGAVMPRRSP